MYNYSMVYYKNFQLDKKRTVLSLLWFYVKWIVRNQELPDKPIVFDSSNATDLSF